MSIDPFHRSRIPEDQKKENETKGAAYIKIELLQLCKKIKTLIKKLRTPENKMPKKLESMIETKKNIILKWETMKLYPNQLRDKRLLDTLHDTIDKIEEFYGDLHAKLPLDLCAMTLEVTEKLGTLPPEAPKPKKNKRPRTPISDSSVTQTMSPMASTPALGSEGAANGSTKGSSATTEPANRPEIHPQTVDSVIEPPTVLDAAPNAAVVRADIPPDTGTRQPDSIDEFPPRGQGGASGSTAGSSAATEKANTRQIPSQSQDSSTSGFTSPSVPPTGAPTMRTEPSRYIENLQRMIKEVDSRVYYFTNEVSTRETHHDLVESHVVKTDLEDVLKKAKNIDKDRSLLSPEDRGTLSNLIKSLMNLISQINIVIEMLTKKEPPK